MKSTARLRILILLVLIGLALASSLWAVWPWPTGDWKGLALNFGTEMGGAVVTYLLLELVIGRIEKRETEEKELEAKKAELIAQMGSQVQDVAVAAVEELRRCGWLHGGSLQGADLRGANLQGANLYGFNLRGVKLFVANLQGADLAMADLREASLGGANLQKARLASAKLQGTYLQGANLQEANLDWAYLSEDTILPDGTNWTPGTDMARFTDPEYPALLRRGKMKIAILRKRFFDTAVGDVLRAIDGRCLVGAITLALCVVEYLAYLCKGSKEKTGKQYRDFVEEFLTKTEPKYKPDWIYALRCALVHTYAQAKAMKNAKLNGYLFTHLNPDFHLSGSDNILRLNVESFVTDAIWLAWRFFDSLPDHPREIEERGDKLLVVGISDSQADKPYQNMHRALKELDEDSPEYKSLYADIRQAIMRSTSGATGSGESPLADEFDVTTETELSVGGAFADGYPYEVNDASGCK